MVWVGGRGRGEKGKALGEFRYGFGSCLQWEKVIPRGGFRKLVVSDFKIL